MDTRLIPRFGYWDMICGLTYGLCWTMTHMHSRRVFWVMSVGSSWFVHLSQSSRSLLVFHLVILSYWEYSSEASNSYGRIVSLSLQFNQSLPHTSWWSVIRRVNVPSHFEASIQMLRPLGPSPLPPAARGGYCPLHSHCNGHTSVSQVHQSWVIYMSLFPVSLGGHRILSSLCLHLQNLA